MTGARARSSNECIHVHRRKTAIWSLRTSLSELSLQCSGDELGTRAFTLGVWDSSVCVRFGKIRLTSCGVSLAASSLLNEIRSCDAYHVASRILPTGRVLQGRARSEDRKIDLNRYPRRRDEIPDPCSAIDAGSFCFIRGNGARGVATPTSQSFGFDTTRSVSRHLVGTRLWETAFGGGGTMTSKGKDDGSIKSKEERRKQKEKRKQDRGAKKDKKRRREKMDGVHAFETDDHGSGREHRRTDRHEKDKGAKKGAVGRKAGMVERSRSNVGDHDLAQRCKPVNKVFYQEHPDVSSLSNSEVQAYRDQLQIAVENLPQGVDARPVKSFHQAGFPSALEVVTSKFRQPSPIQSQAWPLIMAGHDLVGIAATGSGKTLAFGLPAITHILGQQGKSNGQPRCLILAPTRELCQQIGDVMDEACKACGLSCCVVYGGVPKNQQIKELRAGVDIVAATPGRLEDLVESGHCSLQGISFLVLDEADRMLDLGFLPHIRSIVTNIRSDRQTVMFSATWPQEVQSLAVDFMCKPAKCTIGASGLSAASSVSQIVEVMDPKEKDARLDAVLRKYHTSRKNRVLIFVLYKKEAERVEQLLQRRGWECTGVHGDKSQADRTRAVQRFKEGKCPLLIATDVAARGLDIPDVEYVINYTFPLTSEDYVHRIGRTGRAGKTGCSHTFFTFHDKARAGELQNLLRKAGQPVPQELLSFGSTVKKKESKLYGAHFKEVDMMARPTKITFDD